MASLPSAGLFCYHIGKASFRVERLASDESIEYIRSLEAELGERIGWRTFATWYASTDGTVREYGVFLCLLGDGSLYLEAGSKGVFSGTEGDIVIVASSKSRPGGEFDILYRI